MAPPTAPNREHTKQTAAVLTEKLREQAAKRWTEADALDFVIKAGEAARRLSEAIVDEARRIETTATTVDAADAAGVAAAIESAKNDLKGLDDIDWEPEMPPPPPPRPKDKPWTKEELDQLPDYEFQQDVVSTWSFGGRVEARIKSGSGHRLIIAHGPRRFCIYRLVASATWYGEEKDTATLVESRGWNAKEYDVKIKGIAYADTEGVGPDLMNPGRYGPGKGRFPITYVKVWWPDLAGADMNNRSLDSCTTWETRTAVRKLLGATIADIHIYRAALAFEESANKFKVIEEMKNQEALECEEEALECEEEVTNEISWLSDSTQVALICLLVVSGYKTVVLISAILELYLPQVKKVFCSYKELITTQLNTL
ncbi:hypothetical protein DFP73DRAFT_636687 [Morchella snyderi]|nr:hypothetical protein DFP73DRAFT_636687 [Morchella snyderi]